jgi:hypothetical protein
MSSFANLLKKDLHNIEKSIHTSATACSIGEVHSVHQAALLQVHCPPGVGFVIFVIGMGARVASIIRVFVAIHSATGFARIQHGGLEGRSPKSNVH